MSALGNDNPTRIHPKPTFVYQGQRSVYSSEYTDLHGNQYRVDLIGNAQAVQMFRNTRELWVLAETVSDKQREQIKALLAKRSPGQTHSEHAAKLLTPLPELEVHIALVKLVMPRPYWVSFKIAASFAMPVDGGGGGCFPCHEHNMTLDIEDPDAEVSYTANPGTVSVQLGSQESTGSAGFLGELANGRRDWTITVCRCTANPTYTLTGDILPTVGVF